MHHNTTLHNATTVMTMDIAPPTASERQNVETVRQRSTQQRNVRPKNIAVVDAKDHTPPGHMIVHIEMQREGD